MGAGGGGAQRGAFGPGDPPVEPAAAAPTEAIPERCEVHARRAEVEHHATLESFRAGVEAEADATDAQITEALCSAAGVDPGSADCPAEGPWPGLLGFELVLVVPREAGGYDVLRRLGTESPGTESASELRGIELRARAPVAFAVEEEQSEQSCDGEGDDEICGLSMSAMSQRVVLERPDGTFVLVDVGLPLDEAFVRAQAAPTATLEGDGVRVVACGGSGLVPLED